MNARWVRYGNRHGWQITGNVPAAALRVGSGDDFWTKALRVACAAEGGHADAVQCYDAGVMTAGPLGCTATSGTLADLLAEIPEAAREYFIGRLLREQCAELVVRFEGDRNRSYLRRTIGPDGASLNAVECRSVFLGGSDGVAWSDEQKQLALDWTNALHAMLRAPDVGDCVVGASARILRSYMPFRAAGRFGFVVGQPPASAVRREAAACFLAFAINNPVGAVELIDKVSELTADTILIAASNEGGLPSTFKQRVGRTTTALAAESW